MICCPEEQASTKAPEFNSRSEVGFGELHWRLKIISRTLEIPIYIDLTEPCLTPNHVEGEAKLFKDCPSLFELSKNKPISPENAQFIRESRLLIDNGKIYVCCPLPATTTTTTTTPKPQTTTTEYPGDYLNSLKCSNYSLDWIERRQAMHRSKQRPRNVHSIEEVPEAFKACHNQADHPIESWFFDQSSVWICQSRSLRLLQVWANDDWSTRRLWRSHINDRQTTCSRYYDCLTSATVAAKVAQNASTASDLWHGCWESHIRWNRCLISWTSMDCSIGIRQRYIWINFCVWALLESNFSKVPTEPDFIVEEA